MLCNYVLIKCHPEWNYLYTTPWKGNISFGNRAAIHHVDMYDNAERKLLWENEIKFKIISLNINSLPTASMLFDETAADCSHIA